MIAVWMATGIVVLTEAKPAGEVGAFKRPGEPTVMATELRITEVRPAGSAGQKVLMLKTPSARQPSPRPASARSSLTTS